MAETEHDWAAIRADYEAGAKRVRDIQAEYGVSHSAFEARRKGEGWAPRSAPHTIARASLIKRLFRLLDRQIKQLETTMTDEPGDKEVAVLGNLTRNLEKLIELDRKEKDKIKGNRAGAVRTSDIDVLRKKLADRIDRLTKP